MDRRGFLAAFALGTSALSGCLFASDGPPPGSLKIYNRVDSPLTLTIRVEKTSTDWNDAGRLDQTPAPESTPLQTWEAQFTVDGGEDRQVDDFFTEPGAYYIEGDLQSGGRNTLWFELPGNSGGGLDEKYLIVNLLEEGRITISVAGP